LLRIGVDQHANGAPLLGEEDLGTAEDHPVAHHHHAALHTDVRSLVWLGGDQRENVIPLNAQRHIWLYWTGENDWVIGGGGERKEVAFRG
jgi:hypothetical protein